MFSKTSVAIDRGLMFLVSAFFAIAIAGYFTRDTIMIALVALPLALSSTALVGFYKERKAKGLHSKTAELTMVQFYLKPKNFALDTVFNALQSRYKCVKNGEFIIVNDSIAVCVSIPPSALRLEKFCAVFSKLPPATKRLVFITAKGRHSSLARDIAQIDLNVEIKVLSCEQTHILLDRLNSLPDINYNLKPARRSAKEFFVAALSPKASRRYLFTALLLIGSSFFMPTSIYFIIFGAICLLLAIISKIDVLGRLKKE